MEFKAGDEIWFIKHYYPRWPYRPFDTFKVRKGILKSVTTDVNVWKDFSRKELLRTETHYVIKGLPDSIFAKVYTTEAEANEAFKQLNLKEYYKC